MNKDDILKRSQKNDKSQDEYLISVELKVAQYTLNALAVVFVFLTFAGADGTISFLNVTCSLTSFIVFLMALCGVVKGTVRFNMLKKKSSLFWVVVWSLFIIRFLYLL